MDVLFQLSSLLQKFLQSVPCFQSFQPSAALYIFRPASADKISLASLVFILLAFSTLPSCAYILLLLLTVHVAATCLLHTINTAKLQTAEELLSPAASQLQLLKVKHAKLEAVIDQASGLRASIADAQQQEQELARAQALQKKRLEDMEELRSRIQLMQQQLAPLPGLHTRFQMLRHKAKVYSRLKWACKLLRAETSRMNGLLQEYSRLKTARTQMQALQADIAHAQKEVGEVAVLQTHLHNLQQQAAHARAVQAEIAVLEQEVADLQEQQQRLAGLKAAKDKENLPRLAEQGSVNKPCRPYNTTNTLTAGPGVVGMHCIEGITTASKNASAKAPPPHSLPPKPVLAALSAEGGSKQAGGSRSPTTVSGSKIPLHPHSQQQLQQQHHRQQQQQRCASSGGGASGSPSGSTGEIGPSFNRSPNPVFQAQPQHSSSTSSRASNVSGVASFSTVRNPCYGDPVEACTPAYYTPAPFTPGPPPAFTPGPEAAAFAAALEAGLPLSQAENASKSSPRIDAHNTQLPPSSTSCANGSARPPHTLDFSVAANALTPTSGASCLL